MKDETKRKLFEAQIHLSRALAAVIEDNGTSDELLHDMNLVSGLYQKIHRREVLGEKEDDLSTETQDRESNVSATADLS